MSGGQGGLRKGGRRVQKSLGKTMKGSTQAGGTTYEREEKAHDRRTETRRDRSRGNTTSEVEQGLMKEAG